MNKKSLKSKKAFSLIELLVALTVISVFILSFGRLISEVIISKRDLKYQDIAANTAQKKIEDLKQLSYDEIATLQNPPNNNTQLSSESVSDLPQGTTVAFINNYQDPSYKIKEIKVRITWLGRKGQQEEIFFNTLVSENGLSSK